jgi:hypothetical protein
MATMPSRSYTFPIAFRSIVNQVDYLYLYLDGHSEAPEAAKHHPRVVSIFSGDAPGLGSNGKFLGLEFGPADCLYASVDDDIAYPPGYVSRLGAELDAYRGRAVVGYHGSTFTHPFTSYLRSRTIQHFSKQLESTKVVDTLGTGTVFFDTAVLRFDVRQWQHANMDDLGFAIESAKAKLPLVCLQRDPGYIRPLEQNQSDSIHIALKRDDRRQTMLALQLRARKSPILVGPL